MDHMVVLYLRDGAPPSPEHVAFTNETIPMEAFYMTKATWEELGEPKIVTVVVKHGDVLGD